MGLEKIRNQTIRARRRSLSGTDKWLKLKLLRVEGLKHLVFAEPRLKKAKLKARKKKRKIKKKVKRKVKRRIKRNPKRKVKKRIKKWVKRKVKRKK